MINSPDLQVGEEWKERGSGFSQKKDWAKAPFFLDYNIPVINDGAIKKKSL